MRVCKKFQWPLTLKNNEAPEIESTIHKKGSPKIYKNNIFANWEEEITDLAQKLYYDCQKTFFTITR